MSIVRFRGRLGNQMFQYAFAESLRALGREVFFDFSDYENTLRQKDFTLDQVFDDLDLSAAPPTAYVETRRRWRRSKADPKMAAYYRQHPEKVFYYGELEFHKYDPTVFLLEDSMYSGYWQCEQYFKPVEERIRSIYQFKRGEKHLYELGDQLAESFFAVQVRRGDYLKYSRFNVCDPDYYRNGINYIKERFEGCSFVFFSDDIEWVKCNLPVEGAKYCCADSFEDYRPWYDMYLISRCRGAIISNSSFAWWGAWLNDTPGKLIITPDEWLQGVDTPGIWCDDWIRLKGSSDME